MKSMRSAWHWIAAAWVFFLVMGTTAAQSQTETDRYVLQPGDVISISVLEDPLLDRKVLIAPDGRIAMPLAGTVKAEGLTADQLQRSIQNRLRGNFVERPNVTVALESVKEEEEEEELSDVYVLGEVTRPGRYEYEAEDPITVLQALTLAGGLGPFAASERIQVREVTSSTETLRLFNYEAAQDGLLNSSRDLSALQNGAVIVVPERGLFE